MTGPGERPEDEKTPVAHSRSRIARRRGDDERINT